MEFLKIFWRLSKFFLQVHRRGVITFKGNTGLVVVESIIQKTPARISEK